MLNASSTTLVAVETVRPLRRVRLGGASFWVVFAVEALLFALALLALVRALPVAQPLAATPDYDRVRTAIFQRVHGAVFDPLIEVAPGQVAPASSVRGLSLNNATYYYYFEGGKNFDPLSQNYVSANRIQVVLRDEGGPQPLVIYTLTQ